VSREQTCASRAASARSGALRAQNVFVPGAAVQFDGKVLRVDPATGAAAPGNAPTGQNVGATQARRSAPTVATGVQNPERRGRANLETDGRARRPNHQALPAPGESRSAHIAAADGGIVES
jgi:hypothetical protein